MDLSIIIVNWNSKEYLRRCVSSIMATTGSIEFEIVIVDSGSYDGCEEMLRQEFPWVRFIQSDKNRGFARANNVAFKETIGRNLLFLNPDTEIDCAAIEKLISSLNSLPKAGIVGAKLINGDGSIQTSCIQAFPTILNQLLDFNLLRRCFPKAKLWGMKPLFEGNNIPTEVDAVSGACLMIRRTLFEAIGLFSTEYFMYSEDIDLCFKIHKAGWKNYYIPMAIVLHHGGGSSSVDSTKIFSIVMMLESRWRFFRKTRSYWYSQIYLSGMFLTSIIRIGGVLIIWPVIGLSRKRSLIKGILKKWVKRLRWTLGKEKWVKNY